MTNTLPNPCLNLINAYIGLDFGDGKKVTCPYFMNTAGKKFTSLVEAGKGEPHEIVKETLQRLRQQRLDIRKMNPDDVRKFMIDNNLGIDCSGFVARILDVWLKEKVGNSITKLLFSSNKTLYQKLLFALRPFQNIDVMTLTNKNNCNKISLSEIKPGDLIRTRGGKHVLLVTEVECEDPPNPPLTKGGANGGSVLSFVYAHSSGKFEDKSGAKTGKIIISDLNKDLADQNWHEVYNNSIPTRNGWLENKEENGIFRLKILNTITNTLKPKA